MANKVLNKKSVSKAQFDAQVEHHKSIFGSKFDKGYTPYLHISENKREYDITDIRALRQKGNDNQKKLDKDALLKGRKIHFLSATDYKALLAGEIFGSEHFGFAKGGKIREMALELERLKAEKKLNEKEVAIESK